MKIYDTPNKLDKPLINDDIIPLPNYSGFSMLIVGPSGSGKTTALYSMMSKIKLKVSVSHIEKQLKKIILYLPRGRMVP